MVHCVRLLWPSLPFEWLEESCSGSILFSGHVLPWESSSILMCCSCILLGRTRNECLWASLVPIAAKDREPFEPVFSWTIGHTLGWWVETMLPLPGRYYIHTTTWNIEQAHTVPRYHVVGRDRISIPFCPERNRFLLSTLSHAILWQALDVVILVVGGGSLNPREVPVHETTASVLIRTSSCADGEYVW